MRLRRDVAPASWVRQSLAPEQEQILTRLAQTYLTERQWPTWQWLRDDLGLSTTDGERLVRGLPQLGVTQGHYGLSYGFVWLSEGRSGLRIQDGDLVKLTVAGLWRGGATILAQEYLQVLASAVEASLAVRPSLSEAALAEFTNRNVAALDPAVQTLAAGPMYELLHQEPAFQSYSRGSNHSNDGLTWSFSLADGVRRYRAVTSIDSYVDAVNAHLAEVNADLPAALTTSAPPAPSRWKRAGAGVLSFVKGRLQVLAVSTVDKVLASLAGGAVVALVTWLTVLKGHR
jgi:hypothetical protein